MKAKIKKHSVTSLVILLAASSFFFSCNDTVNQHTGDFTFDSLQVNQTAHLFGDTAKPACNININFTYITKSSDEQMKDSVNKYLLSMCFGDKYMTMDPENAPDKYAETYIENYCKDLEPMYKQESVEDSANVSAWYSYYKGMEGHVQLYGGNLLVYRISYNEYTGGAHGVYMTSYLNLQLDTLTPIYLDDLFVPNYKDALTDLLWNQLMADNQVTTHEELENMGYTSIGELTPTENFFIDSDGITFHYNIYDIAPYVMGAIQIKLPYDAVRHLLNDNTIISQIN